LKNTLKTLATNWQKKVLREQRIGL
jgi:hypothetical protein